MWVTLSNATWIITICSDILNGSGITLNRDLVTEVDLMTEFDLYLLREMQRMQHANKSYLILSHLGFACVLMLRKVSPELVIFF